MAGINNGQVAAAIESSLLSTYIFLRTHEGNKPIRNMKSRQSDKKKTKQVRIDAGLHKQLKIKAATENTRIKTLIEGCLADLLEVKND
ncbi:MAG: hypothetical protein PHV63_02715 [Candidatus Daviesbacteria bacterium]|nr:hypothetical protein [Candidatus Daviesbacteria bacterium]